MKNFFKYVYKSEVHINATKESVWNTLVDWSSYPTWNPFTIRIDSEWELGKEVYLTVKMKPNHNPMIRTEYLTKFLKHEEISWGFSWGWFLKAMRKQKLIKIDELNTRYTNEDVVEGLLSPLVHMLFGKWVQQGFNSLSLALKNRIENHDIKK